MAQKIVVTNRKGGVGKTTTAVTLAARLALEGFNVGVIDMDDQSHASTALGITPDGQSLFAVIAENANPVRHMIPVPTGNYIEVQPGVNVFPGADGREYTLDEDVIRNGALYIVPSDGRNFSLALHGDVNTFAHRYNKALDRIADAPARVGLEPLDFIVIDTQPSTSLSDGGPYFAGDHWLYVTDSGDWGLMGVINALEHGATFAEMRRDYLGLETNILGVLPNKIRANVWTDDTNVAHIATEFGFAHSGGHMLPVWNLYTAWQQAAKRGRGIFAYARGTKAAAQAWDATQVIMERLTGQAVTHG